MRRVLIGASCTHLLLALLIGVATSGDVRAKTKDKTYTATLERGDDSIKELTIKTQKPLITLSKAKKNKRPLAVISGSFSKSGSNLTWNYEGSKKNSRVRKNFKLRVKLESKVTRIEFKSVSASGKMSRETVAITFKEIAQYAKENGLDMPGLEDEEDGLGIGTFRIGALMKFGSANAALFNDANVLLASLPYLNFSLDYQREVWKKNLAVAAEFDLTIPNRTDPDGFTVANSGGLLISPSVGAILTSLGKVKIIGMFGIPAYDVITNATTTDVTVEAARSLSIEAGVRVDQLFQFSGFDLNLDARLTTLIPIGGRLTSGFGQDIRVELMRPLGKLYGVGAQLFFMNNQLVTDVGNQNNTGFGLNVIFMLDLK